MTSRSLAWLAALALVTQGCGGGSDSSSTPRPAQLAGDDADGAHDFGTWVSGVDTATVTWTITNTGDEASGTPTVSVSGADAAFFDHVTTCLVPLPAQGSCTVTITFAPESLGAVSANFTVTAAQGGTVTLAVSGTGLRPALLASSDADGVYDFGLLETGVASPALTWTLTNTGDVATGPVSVHQLPGDPGFSGSTTCDGPLAAGASCTVTLALTPVSASTFNATFVVGANPGGTVELDLTGAGGGVRLTVAKTGMGAVTSSPAGIVCGTDCTEVYPPGTAVTLEARTTNGLNSYFRSWGGACSGSFRDCSVDLTASATASATFSLMVHNAVFVTSGAFPANLGGTAPYDAACNAAATAAGINNRGGDAYVAWISDADSNVIDRLGTARGWMLLDGRPFTDSLDGLTTNRVVWNPITVDETGLRLEGGYMWTGTLGDGTSAAENCTNWTVTSVSVSGRAGERGEGPGLWTGAATPNCTGNLRLYCFMKTKTEPLADPPTVAGLRMWVTATAPAAGGGLGAMDTLCNDGRPVGATTGRALVATSTRSAASLLADGNYVSVAGQLIATGADLKNNVLPLLTGPWQTGNGTFATGAVTTGATAVNAVGTLASTCQDWSSILATDLHIRGHVSTTDGRWFMLNDTYQCTTLYPVLCVEY